MPMRGNGPTVTLALCLAALLWGCGGGDHASQRPGHPLLGAAPEAVLDGRGASGSNAAPELAAALRSMREAASGERGSRSSWASTLAVPLGSRARGTRPGSRSPLSTSLTVPSPPTATATSKAWFAACLASLTASPGPVVSTRLTRQPNPVRCVAALPTNFWNPPKELFN